MRLSHNGIIVVVAYNNYSRAVGDETKALVDSEKYYKT